MQQSEQTFLSGPNAAFVVELYARYAEDPQSVDPDWRAYFASLGEEAAAALADLKGPSWAPRKAELVVNGVPAPSLPAPGPNGAAEPGAIALTPAALRAAASDSIRAIAYIRVYRVRGHLEADLDPLGLKPIQPHPELDPRTYGFSEADMDRPIYIGNLLGLETPTLAPDRRTR